MNKLLISVLVSLTLAGCGGGSDTNSGAGGVAPAEDTPVVEGGGDAGGGEDDGGGEDGGGATPADQIALTAECIEQPADFVSPGQEALATLKFNQQINTTAIVTSMCSAGPTLFANQSIDVVFGQGSVTQSIPGSCAGGSYQVNFQVEEHSINKSCTWTVPEFQIFMPGG